MDWHDIAAVVGLLCGGLGLGSGIASMISLCSLQKHIGKALCEQLQNCSNRGHNTSDRSHSAKG